MPHRLGRTERRQRTRAELVESAIRRFAEDGVARTPVEAVAEAAGYSRGAYHSNFGSRDELLDAVVARVVDDLAPHLSAVLSSSARRPLDRLAAYITEFLRYCERQPVRTRALVAVVRHRTTTADSGYDAMVEASLTDLVSLFAQGQATGEMRRFDRTLMAGLLRRALDAVALRIAHGTPARPITEELVKTFVHATRADSQEP